MKINLCDVLSVSGREIAVDAVFCERQVTVQGETIKLSGIHSFEVVVKHIKKDMVAVAFDAEVSVSRPCSRCLEDVVRNYDVHVKRTINPIRKEALTDETMEYEEISYIEDCTLDVDMLLLDELYTVLPMNILCKDDCRGICKVCGNNLNKSTCGCDQKVPDPRMAVFSDIFNQFKEV